MQHHGSKYFAGRPPPTLGRGSIGQTSTFSEHGHVAYQIKEIYKCSNMVALFCPKTPILGMGSIGQNSTFRTWSYCISNLRESPNCSSLVTNILPADPSRDGVSRVKCNFSEHGHVEIPIKGNHECSKMVANILPTDPPPPSPPRPWGWGQ